MQLHGREREGSSCCYRRILLLGRRGFSDGWEPAHKLLPDPEDVCVPLLKQRSPTGMRRVQQVRRRENPDTKQVGL